MYTNQTAFDKIVTHLSQMKERSVADVIYCKYRNHDGNRCAIGCLIHDELYDTTMDEGNYTIGQLIKNFVSIETLFENCNIDMLYQLQNIHDNIGNWNDEGIVKQILPTLVDIASEFNISPDVAIKVFEGK